MDSHGGRSCATYRLLSFESHFAFQNGKQSASINKTKQDVNVSEKKQTKKKKSSEVDEWVTALESPWQELMRIWFEYKKSRKEAYGTVMGAKS